MSQSSFTWDSMHDFRSFLSVALTAAAEGTRQALLVLQQLRLISVIQFDSASPMLSMTAAAYGSLEVLEWLASQHIPACWDHPQMAFQAASKSHWNILKWMQAQYMLNSHAFDLLTSLAVLQGDLELLAWIMPQVCNLSVVLSHACL